MKSFGAFSKHISIILIFEKNLKMPIELRSDTFTIPTPAMQEAMWQAKVGDDVFEEDPTVNELETFAAKMFGKEAALFCASGTMTNQIAIKLHTQPGDEVICDKYSHVYYYEGGGIAFNSAASVRLLDGDRGRISAAQIVENINPDNIHYPASTLVCLENTANKGGGACYSLETLQAIKQICMQHKLKLHLDGARIFNAIVAQGYSAFEIGAQFDTLSVCLSKGLGAPVGSLLIGNKEQVKKARRIRKVLGGGWRQAGFLAAAGLYALQNNIVRLADDHARAAKLAQAIEKLPYVDKVLPVETNIVIYQLHDNIPLGQHIESLATKGLMVSAFGKQQVRMVTHLQFTDHDLDKTIQIMQKEK